MVVQAAGIEDPEVRFHRAGSRIQRPEHDCCDARLDDGTGTHCARFKGHPKFRAGETVVARPSCGLAQGDDFCMRARILVNDGAIVACGKKFAVPHHHSSNRNFAKIARRFRLLQGQAHPVFFMDRWLVP